LTSLFEAQCASIAATTFLTEIRQRNSSRARPTTNPGFSFTMKWPESGTRSSRMFSAKRSNPGRNAALR
jgi:hypothetical protein